MASFASVRHHGWRTQAAWTNNLNDIPYCAVFTVIGKTVQTTDMMEVVSVVVVGWSTDHLHLLELCWIELGCDKNKTVRISCYTAPGNRVTYFLLKHKLMNQ